jgi:biopolymer transport protein TolR
MAGAGPMMPSSGGRRSLDAEINLVPFIDLLSVCICFLLMTAVWIQLSTVQVKQSHGTEAGEAGNYELDLRFGSPTAIELLLKKNGKTVKKAAFQSPEFKQLLASVDGQLTGWLSGITPAAALGQPVVSPVTAAMVTPKAGVSYGDLVSAMDVLRKHQIVNLGVVPVGEGK